MTPEEIKQSEGWKYISSLSLTQRYEALFGSSQSAIEKAYNVKVEKRHFTEMSNIKTDWVTLSVNDSFRGISMIAVLSGICITQR